MTASNTESGKKYDLSTLHMLAVFLWCNAVMFGLILYGNCLMSTPDPVSWSIAVECGTGWIVAGLGSTVGIGLAVMQLIIILNIAFGALFLAAHLIVNHNHGKTSRALVAIFISFMFGGFPILGLNAT